MCIQRTFGRKRLRCTMARSHIPGGSLYLILMISLLFCVFGKKCSLRGSLQALSFVIKVSFVNKKWGCIDGLQFLLNIFLQFLSRLREISVRTQCATFSVFSGNKSSLRGSLQALSFVIKVSFINKKWGCIDDLQFLLNKFLQFLSRLREIFVRTQCATFSVFSGKKAHFEAVCRLCRSLLRFLSLIKNGAALMGYNFC